MLALLFCVPNVLWITLRHGGLSTVPSILTTWKCRGPHLTQPDSDPPLLPSLTTYLHQGFMRTTKVVMSDNEPLHSSLRGPCPIKYHRSASGWGSEGSKLGI